MRKNLIPKPSKTALKLHRTIAKHIGSCDACVSDFADDAYAPLIKACSSEPFASMIKIAVDRMIGEWSLTDPDEVETVKDGYKAFLAALDDATPKHRT